MTNRETLDALDEAGRLLAPILDVETRDSFGSTAMIYLNDGAFKVIDQVGLPGSRATVVGKGETLSAAFVQFLANRSDKLAELEREAQERAEFEAFKALKREAA